MSDSEFIEEEPTPGGDNTDDIGRGNVKRPMRIGMETLMKKLSAKLIWHSAMMMLSRKTNRKKVMKKTAKLRMMKIAQAWKLFRNSKLGRCSREEGE